MWQHNGTTIKEGNGWKDSNGIQHPPNWHIWTVEDKKAAGLKEVIPETPPDSRLYTWSQNADGTINKTARALADSGSGDTLVLGVKSTLKNEVKTQQGRLLSVTDWAVIRKADKGTAIPSNIQTYRDAIRTKATEMEDAIDGAANTDAIAALFLSYDADQNKSGILYDWPELS